jgi:hypothetical protein
MDPSLTHFEKLPAVGERSVGLAVFLVVAAAGFGDLIHLFTNVPRGLVRVDQSSLKPMRLT